MNKRIPMTKDIENMVQFVGEVYGKMPLTERIKSLKQMCKKDKAFKDFLKRLFPQFFKECFPNG